MHKALISSFLCLSLLLNFGCESGSGKLTDRINNKQSSDASESPIITFRATEYDFGRVAEGAIVTHSFSFTNTGSVPLIISNASASCGCTVPTWPHGAIAPGDTGNIYVEFNTKNKNGDQNKNITIASNANPSITIVSLKGFVLNANVPTP